MIGITEATLALSLIVCDQSPCIDGSTELASSRVRWYRYERVFKPKLSRDEAYRYCRAKYDTGSIIVMRFSKGWICRVRVS